jgi:hypothetical protein
VSILHHKFDIVYETNFWLSPAQIGPFFESDDIHLANELGTSSVAAMKAIAVKNRLRLLTDSYSFVSSRRRRTRQ